DALAILLLVMTLKPKSRETRTRSEAASTSRGKLWSVLLRVVRAVAFAVGELIQFALGPRAILAGLPPDLGATFLAFRRGSHRRSRLARLQDHLSSSAATD